MILIWSRNVRNNPAILPFQILLVLFIIAAVILSLFSLPIHDTWILLERLDTLVTRMHRFFFSVTWQYIGYRISGDASGTPDVYRAVYYHPCVVDTGVTESDDVRFLF